MRNLRWSSSPRAMKRKGCKQPFSAWRATVSISAMPETDPDFVLNAISTTVQLQEHYLAQRPEQLQQLLSETTQDLKHAVERLQFLLEKARELLNHNITTD